MNKRHLHHVWTVLRKVHPLYFLGLTLLLGILCLVNLRHNNQHMVELRSAVYSADKNDGNVELALQNLRTYVYAHMNTSLTSGADAVHPPIQLKYTYERLQAAQQTSLSQNNAAIYNQAQQSCSTDAAAQASGAGMISCIEDYAANHGIVLTPIPDGLYKFDFTAAKWSPDAAGWTAVATVLSALLFITTLVYRWWAKKYL